MDGIRGCKVDNRRLAGKTQLGRPRILGLEKLRFSTCRVLTRYHIGECLGLCRSDWSEAEYHELAKGGIPNTFMRVVVEIV